MVRELYYDEVFDAQKHFRALLDSMARPGKINVLEPVPLDPPPGLNAASALAGFALMDADSTFEVIGMMHGEAAYLASNTNARRVETAKAHFIFARGSESPDFLESADCGTLLYPDTAATVVLQLDAASRSPLPGGLRLTLEGPGIDGRGVLYVRGLNADLLLALQARNAEFPLGIDTILTFANESGAPALAALPRTTRVSWENC
ncbi:MAG TPA: phosphonate C-P lyase system protein PhnH [Bryobacteraceae bacterium]|nr:phosphonate C-P lyase system protein PhnH [Bryobacteraceae bacterium]